MTIAAPPPPAAAPAGPAARGAGLVLAAAVVWSAGGLFVRLLGSLDPWTVVCWRAGCAALFLLGFMLWRDGPRGTIGLFRAMGGAGLAVALLFGFGSTAFVVALEHTTVANILLIQAGVPLLAALGGRIFLGEAVSRITWAAIAAVLAGVAVMVSGSLTGGVAPVGDALAVAIALGEPIAGPTWAAIAATLLGVAVMVSGGLGGAGASPTGDLLALTIAVAFALATVITRAAARVPMVPAVCLAAVAAGLFAATRAPGLAVAPRDLGLLAGFGAGSFGLGLALFVTGARMVPAATAALVGLAETVLGPFWVWLAWGETPSARTLLGGGIVLAALLAHLAWTRGGLRRRG